MFHKSYARAAAGLVAIRVVNGSGRAGSANSAASRVWSISSHIPVT